MNEAALAVTHDSQDNVYFTGRGLVDIQGIQMLTLKLDASDGHVVWVDYHGGSAGLDDVAWDIVVGPDDNPVVTGYVVGEGNEAFCLTRKLNKVNGDEIWSRQVPGALDNNAARSSWLVSMDGGDVVMCQRSWGSGYDTILQRYAANNGDTVWEIVYDGPTGGGDDPKAMVRDAAGNLLIAGVQDISFNYNYMVLKFDSSDGSLIWEADGYDGPGGGWWDVATCITEGPGGDVIVSGVSDGSSTGTGWDMATVAYDATTGDELWAHRWDGPVSGSDEARDLAVTAAGDIYVTGYGYGEDSGKDMITLRLDASGVSPVADLPEVATLMRAWPNPFNPRVNFDFELPRTANLRLTVFDLRGHQIAVLLDDRLESGTHRASWDGRGTDGRAVASGVYLAIMESELGRSSRKIVLEK